MALAGGSPLAPTPAVSLGSPVAVPSIAPVAIAVPARTEPPASTAVAIPARPPFARPFVALHAGPAAFWRIPALADRLQADLALRVDLLDLDGELVAHLDRLFHRREPLAPAELGDVDQAVPRGEDIDEGAERGRLHHGPVEALPDLRQAGVHDGLDHVHGPLRALAVAGPDEHASVVLDVDVGPGQGDDLVDALALRPDHLADLVHRDLLHDHPGSLERELVSRRGDGASHRLQDEQPCFLRLLECPGQDLRREAAHLGVELETRDEVLGPGDL